jgi:hypothetical protein
LSSRSGSRSMDATEPSASCPLLLSFRERAPPKRPVSTLVVIPPRRLCCSCAMANCCLVNSSPRHGCALCFQPHAAGCSNGDLEHQLCCRLTKSANGTRARSSPTSGGRLRLRTVTAAHVKAAAVNTSEGNASACSLNRLADSCAYVSSKYSL